MRAEAAASAIAHIVAAGVRAPWKRMEPAGVAGIPRVFLSADEESYVYSYVRLLDELFLVEGPR